MRYILKLLNPFIWLWNVINYFGHLDMQRHISNEDYERYDFSKDIKYF